jgi:hypothetical protein
MGARRSHVATMQDCWRPRLAASVKFGVHRKAQRPSLVPTSEPPGNLAWCNGWQPPTSSRLPSPGLQVAE